MKNLKHWPWASNVLLGIYSSDIKTHVHPKTCISMFIGALLIIVKEWIQPKYPSSGEWIIVTYPYTMESCLATKRNDDLIQDEICIKAENITRTERSQPVRTNHHILYDSSGRKYLR